MQGPLALALVGFDAYGAERVDTLPAVCEDELARVGLPQIRQQFTHSPRNHATPLLGDLVQHEERIDPGPDIVQRLQQEILQRLWQGLTVLDVQTVYLPWRLVSMLHQRLDIRRRPPVRRGDNLR